MTPTAARILLRSGTLLLLWARVAGCAPQPAAAPRPGAGALAGATPRKEAGPPAAPSAAPPRTQ